MITETTTKTADATKTIVVDLERCTGCWTCAFSCKFGHDMPDDKWMITVRTLGSGEGIDKPAGTWPNLHMDWMPIWSDKCMKCAKCSDDYPEPFCVHNCPTGALCYGDPDYQATAAGAKVEQAKETGRRMFKLPEYENSRDNILYINRKI